MLFRVHRFPFREYNMGLMRSFVKPGVNGVYVNFGRRLFILAF